MTLFRVLLPLLVLAFAVFAQPAAAQLSLLTASSEEPASSGLETLINEAKKDGSTVIIVRPNQAKTEAENAAGDEMRAERFLKARARMGEIVASSATLWESLKGTLAQAGSHGSYWWILRAIGTAVLGTLIGTYITGRTFRWMDANFAFMKPNEPKTSADKVQYLLVRTLLAVFLVGIAVFSSFVVAVILDSGHEPTRRLIFEIIMANATYRFLRHGVSWNLFAGAMPKHRIVNLTDEEAISLHRDFHLGALVAVVFAGFARFVSFTAEDQIAAGMTNVLSVENIKLLQLCSALLVTVLVVLFVLKNRKALQHIVAPRETSGSFHKLRATLARLVPAIWIAYCIAAMLGFNFRLSLDLPAPGVVIAAPFVILYGSVLVYGVVLLIIQAHYDRRLRRFNEMAEMERAKHQEDVKVLDVESGEEMVVGPAVTPDMHFQPVFRQFFENAALAIIMTVAIAELGRLWGYDVRDDGNVLAAFLDIGLATILCWLAYRAVTIFIDKRIEEEGGAPEEAEMGGDGGGAGASRMATLLPILRYVMVITLVSIGGMIILSRMGFDIGPIFAGAGVVGIAVGFGAQTLIRDIFSGAFFLMDDAFRRGEYVEIDQIRGTVEKISIRSFQLRHHLGALHTIPFGEIRQLTNYSRDWVLMKLPLRVTYDTDVEKVRKLVKKLGQQLLEHPQVGHTFMQPLKSQGVYKMEDSAMIIRVKFMTKPGEQFVTRKVVYESIQDLFAREGIHFAHKEVTVRLADGASADNLSEDEKQAVASAARSVIDAEEEAAAAAAGGKGSEGGR